MHKPKLVGIVNITPDSFSDGGNNVDVKAAGLAIERLMADGADVVDIGAESTRPGATPLSAQEEWARLKPIMRLVRDWAGHMIFSLDTRHGDNAKRALEHGFSWINDVSGFTSSGMVEVAMQSSCKLVMMHSLSVPADKNITLPESADVMKELAGWAAERKKQLESKGVDRNRLVFDPGIGFGKTARQSQDIIRRAAELKALGLPVLVGHSRKSFLTTRDMDMAARDKATLDYSYLLAQAGVEYLRVHNVALHRQWLDTL